MKYCICLTLNMSTFLSWHHKNNSTKAPADNWHIFLFYSVLRGKYESHSYSVVVQSWRQVQVIISNAQDILHNSQISSVEKARPQNFILWSSTGNKPLYPCLNMAFSNQIEGERYMVVTLLLRLSKCCVFGFSVHTTLYTPSGRS